MYHFLNSIGLRNRGQDVEFATLSICLITYASYTWVSPVGKKQDDVTFWCSDEFKNQAQLENRP